MVKQKIFLIQIAKMYFLVDQLINHGGQNPLEAARYGCNIFMVQMYRILKKFISFL